jgi:hypothetical protein
MSVVRWFCMQRLLDAAAAADMLAWVNSQRLCLSF